MKNEDLYVYKKSDFYEDYISSQKEYYEREQVDTLLAEKDREIAELKKKLMPCINGDCILTCEVVEKYGKENAELKTKLEDVQASAYTDSVDAGMRERGLRRALWLMRLQSLRNFSVLAYFQMIRAKGKKSNMDFNEMAYRIDLARVKCRTKAEEYR
jgi:hypothetical protein